MGEEKEKTSCKKQRENIENKGKIKKLIFIERKLSPHIYIYIKRERERERKNGCFTRLGA